MKKLLLMIATIAMMTACGGNGNSTSGSKSGSEASDGPKSYSVEYNIGALSGPNCQCFDPFSSDKIKTDFEAKIDGDKVTITMPLKLKVTGKELEKSLAEGYYDFCIENSSSKGKIRFTLADPDKVDYDAEYKKLKEGDTFEVKIVGETTKDILDKMNNNWGSFATWI